MSDPWGLQRRPPGYIEKVNGIMNYFEYSCDINWMLYLELAAPAAGHALLTLVEFDFADVVRGALRPRGLRSHRHGRRGRRGGRGRPGIPEFGELIGKNIPGSDDWRGRQISGGAKQLWLLDGVIQRVLWYWLVVDVTIDFYYEWTSAIMQSEACHEEFTNACHYTSADDIILFKGGEPDWPLPSTTPVHLKGIATAQLGVHWNGGLSFTAIDAIQAVPGAIPGGPLVMRTKVGSTISQNNESSYNEDNNSQDALSNQGSQGPLVVTTYGTGGGSYIGKTDSFTFGRAISPSR